MNEGTDPIEADLADWAPGDWIDGIVIRAPHPDHHRGSSIVIRPVDGDDVLIVGSAKLGHAALERALQRLACSAGDRVRVAFSGWRTTTDGRRRYRLWTVISMAERPSVSRGADL